MSESPLQRRSFLHLGALACGLPYLRPRSGRAAVLPANERIRVGLIGAGARGQLNLRALIKRPEIQLTAVCDVDATHRNNSLEIVHQAYGSTDAKSFEDFRDLISADLVDAVVLAVPTHWQAAIAIACAQTHIDIYAEPPLAGSVVEGRAICRAVQRYGCVWQTGSWQRSDPFFQSACQLVATGRLGVVRSLEVGTLGGFRDYTGATGSSFYEDAGGLNYDLWLGPAPWLPYHPGRVHQNWRWHSFFGGGQLMDMIGHHVDIALWAQGLDRSGPLKVEGKGEFMNNAIFDALVKYDISGYFRNDLKIRISSSLAPGVRWLGDEGWIYATRKQLLASKDSLLAPGEFASRFIRFGQDHWGDFFDAMRTRRPTIAPCESAQRAATIGHLSMISLLAGRTITWRDETEMVFEDPNAAEMLEKPYREPWLLVD